MSGKVFESINNPKAFRNASKEDKEREVSWTGEIEQFKTTAETIYQGHKLFQKAEEEVAKLSRNFKSILEVSREYFEKISEETGYQEGLIAAIYEIAWKEGAEGKTEK